MARTKPLNGKMNIKQASGADLPLSPVKYVTQRGTQTSSLGQTIINLPFAIDVTNKDSVLIIVDGQVLAEGTGNDYSFTSINSSNVSSQITLNQPIPAAGLGITTVLLGMQVQQEPSINTLAATVAGLSTTNSTGGINYLAASDAEKTISGWNRYFNTAGVLPTTGTGGAPSASVTFTQSTVNPLRGTASFLLTKDAANRQGEGVSYDFTIDTADKASMLAVSFDYNASANFVPGLTSSDAVISIYDKTNNVLIPLAPQYIPQPTGKFKAVFQSASNSTAYRVIVHIASTNALAWTMQLDNVQVGPQSVTYGVPASDEKIYTMVIGGSTTAPTKVASPIADIASWRRVGNQMVIRYNYVQGSAGSGGSGTYLYPLPAGYQIDPAFVTFQSSANTASGQQVGFGQVGNTQTNGTSNLSNLRVFAASATQLLCVSAGGASESLQYVQGSGNYSIGGGALFLTFEATVPILGWSSNVVMSSDTDTRVCGAKYGTSTSGTSSATVPYNCDVKIYDTHNAVTTGASWKFTAPLPGVYMVKVSITTTAANAGVAIFKNGSNYENLGNWYTNPANQLTFGTDIQMIAGDYFDIRCQQNTQAWGAGGVVISVVRVSGPAQIAATESTNAKYTLSANVTSDPSTPIIYNTKVFDTHNAFNSTTGKYTVPSPGKYRVTAIGAASAASNVQLYKNGSNDSLMGGWDGSHQYSTTTLVSCVQGDLLDVRTNASVTVSGSGGQAILIERVGN